MKIRSYILIFTVVTFTSCKAFKKLASRDNSSIGQKPTHKIGNNQLVFIDDIDVAPGKKVTTTHSTKNRKKTKADEQEVIQIQPDVTLQVSQVESLDNLQFKYAIILDATVERLTNVDLLNFMDKWWGTRYCLGGSTETCIDCSAFTKTTMNELFKTDLPRTAQEQYNVATKIEQEELEEGDLIFFQTTRNRDITHVGIYLMNNKFLHASTSNGVTVSDLNETYWKQHYKSCGRVLQKD